MFISILIISIAIIWLGYETDWFRVQIYCSSKTYKIKLPKIRIHWMGIDWIDWVFAPLWLMGLSSYSIIELTRLIFINGNTWWKDNFTWSIPYLPNMVSFNFELAVMWGLFLLIIPSLMLYRKYTIIKIKEDLLKGLNEIHA